MTNTTPWFLSDVLPKFRRAALLLALACAGCMAGGDSPDDETPDDTPDAGTVQKARLTVNWSIKNVDGSAVSCGSQYTQVKVHAQAYQKDSGIRTGDPFTQLFDCGAGTGSMELPLSGDAETGGFRATDINGRYDVWVSQTEPSGQLDRQVSLTTYQLDLSTGNKSATATLYENGGYHLFNWALIAESTGNTITCAASGIDTVEVVSLNEATGQTTTNRFPCAGDPNIDPTGYAAVGAGLSSVLLAGRYTFTVNAYANNVKVGSSEPDTEEEVQNLSRINIVADNHFVRITTR
jgi:hypothetical protein